MFDLEHHISAWRQQMRAAGIKTPVPLEELETHLREDVEGQISAGTGAQAAFTNAVSQVGQPGVLKNEFGKAGETIQERVRKLIFALAGNSNLQPATNMNNINSNSEPRLATYARAGAFIFPAAFLWLFTVIFVLPKVNEICQAAGTTVYNFSNTPMVFRASAFVGQVMFFLTTHGFLICGAILLTVFLLERYFESWARYRRLAIGLGVYLLNGVVLLSLTMMIVSILIAAPILLRHAH